MIEKLPFLIQIFYSFRFVNGRIFFNLICNEETRRFIQNICNEITNNRNNKVNNVLTHGLIKKEGISPDQGPNLYWPPEELIA